MDMYLFLQLLINKRLFLPWGNVLGFKRFLIVDNMPQKVMGRRSMESVLFDIFWKISVRHKRLFFFLFLDYVSELEHLVSLSLSSVSSRTLILNVWLSQWEGVCAVADMLHPLAIWYCITVSFPSASDKMPGDSARKVPR